MPAVVAWMRSPAGPCLKSPLPTGGFSDSSTSCPRNFATVVAHEQVGWGRTIFGRVIVGEV